MKWNRKSLLNAGKQVAKAVDARDFEGKSADEFVTYLEGLCKDAQVTVNGLIEDSEFDADAIRKAWNAKTVRIVADAGEEVIVEDGIEAVDGEDEEVKAADEDEDEVTKAYKAFRKVAQKNGAKDFPGLQGLAGASAKGTGFRFGDRRSAVLKAYDRAIKDGTALSKTGKTPLFGDAERMEAFNAATRFIASKGRDYPQKSADERIATKTGLVSQNSTGGSLVFGEFFPELIENFNEHGAARAAIGITPMAEGVRTVSKMDSDITVYDVGEADSITASDPAFSNVSLVAKKTAALGKISAELQNDAAFQMSDVYARSMLRKMREFEDDSVFNSANNRDGVSNLVGANTTFDAALSSDWSDYTITDLQDWLGKLPAWAREDPKFGIACSWQFYMRVLRRFALSAGGNTGQMVLGGVSGAANGNVWQWDGIPVYISQKLPTSYSANQLVAYAGAWSYATKFGVVTGSETVASSDQRYFDEDSFAIRMTQRWAINLHDVNNTAFGSGIVALKD